MRYALRALLRSPGFTAATVLLMALGIGAATACFSLAYGVLLRPLPWPEPGRLVRVLESRGGNPGRVPWTISNTSYHAWREAPSTIEEIGGWMRGQSMTMTAGSAEPARVHVGRLTPSLLRVLRVHPAAGRLLTDEDAVGDGPRAVLLGFGLWQRRFGGSADMPGRTIRLDGRTVTVAGIMPREFVFPDRETEAWLPLSVARVARGADVIPAMIFNAAARLRPGASPEQAAAEATARARAAPKLGLAAVALFGSDGDASLAVVPMRDALTADVRPALAVLLAAVGLLFCTALASVVVLQASRAVKRRREMAVRAAIGASPGRLARNWLAESALLALGGGAAGLLLASALHQGLPVLLPADFPRAWEVRLDGAAVAFAALASLCTAILCGVAPATQIRAGTLVEWLAPGGAISGAGTRGRWGRLRGAMMVLQVAIACVLLVGTGLLARSFAALLSADRGFDPRHVLTAHLVLTPRPFTALSATLDRVHARLRALPGVTHVASGNALPFVTTGGFHGFTLPSPAEPSAKIQAQTLTRTVDPEYFGALGLRVLAGRPLARTDTSSSRPVVVVNRTFAAQYLGPDPVGRTLPFAARDWEIVGVVDDVRQGGLSGVAPAAFGGLAEPRQPELFFTSRQWDARISELVFVVRGGDPAALGPALRSILRDEDPSLALDSIMTMDERVMSSLSRPRTYAVLIGGFAVFALLVAAVGLFGALSYTTAQRTREFGVRTALGARPKDILRLVSRDAAAIAAGGLAAGLAGAFALARALHSLLYGISAHDAVTFIAVPVVLLVVVSAACAIPARRAARVSPLTALRSE